MRLQRYDIFGDSGANVSKGWVRSLDDSGPSPHCELGSRNPQEYMFLIFVYESA